MSFLKLNISYDENLVTPRAHAQILNRCYREEMEYHKSAILPRHFMDVPETRPGSMYGYAARSTKWNERKRREGLPLIPNVYSGQMRFIVLWQSVVRATSSHGTLTARNYFAMTTARRMEIESVSTREQDRLVKRMEARYAILANSPEYARKRRPKRLRG